VTDRVRTGRFVLAGACVLNWGAGLVLAVPPFVSALLLAFVSGAVIVNSAIMELPSEKDGRFWPFVMGGLSYGLRCCHCTDREGTRRTTCGRDLAPTSWTGSAAR
jgi:hypothetical protein